MRVAITGHRPPRLRGREDEVYSWIEQKLTELNCTEAYSGMATGTDQLFAKAAIAHGIPLVCCYPFKKDKFSSEESDLMAKSMDIRFISEEYSKKAYYIRDKYMVDNCDLLLAVFDGKHMGGTWLTVNYAERINKPIIYFRLEKIN